MILLLLQLGSHHKEIIQPPKMVQKSAIFWLFALVVLHMHIGVAALFRRAPTCNQLVDEYQLKHGKHASFQNVSDAFIFFLHVPRTAGKTYASCFLRAALPPSQRCSPAYDLLRLNISQEHCRYVVSHDDYSLTSVSSLKCPKLPFVFPYRCFLLSPLSFSYRTSSLSFLLFLLRSNFLKTP